MHFLQTWGFEITCIIFSWILKGLCLFLSLSFFCCLRDPLRLFLVVDQKEGKKGKNTWKECIDSIRVEDVFFLLSLLSKDFSLKFLSKVSLIFSLVTQVMWETNTGWKPVSSTSIHFLSIMLMTEKRTEITKKSTRVCNRKRRRTGTEKSCPLCSPFFFPLILLKKQPSSFVSVTDFPDLLLLLLSTSVYFSLLPLFSSATT